MLNKIMFTGLMIVLVFSFFTGINAQEKTSKEKHKTEMHQPDHHKHHKMSDEKAAAKPWNEVCPVRGNKVQEGTATVKYEEKEYGFCCPGCDSKFEKEPEKYSKNLSKDGKKFIGKK